MTVISKLQETIEKVKIQKADGEEELKKLEEEFSNVKLNPYGVTSIDFSKRQEITADLLKMEGVIMGLTLAIETLTGVEEGVTAE
jgi:hypothetical protein